MNSSRHTTPTPTLLLPGGGRGCEASHSVRCSKRSRGFTLIEVLVALAVLAIALAAIMRVVAQSADTAIALRDRQQAMWVAQDRLREHVLQRDWPSPDTRSGVSQFAGREWHWREQVITTPLKELRRVEIDISAGDSQDTLAHLVGFLRDPQS